MLKKVCGYEIGFVHLLRDPRYIYESVLRGDNIKLEKGEDPRMSFPLLRTINGWMLANIGALLNRKLLKNESAVLIR